MSGTLPSATVRRRLAGLIRSLAAEDLEERVAPVKCSKHPDSPDCGGEDYGVPLYMAPEYAAPSPETPGE